VGHYAEIVTGHYFSIEPAAVVGCDEPEFFCENHDTRIF